MYLPDLKLLYIFDILIPSILPTWLRGSKVAAPRPNFGSFMAGFHVADKKLCEESAKALLSLDVELLCFSHGDFDFGAIVRGKEQVKEMLSPLNSLLHS